MWLFKKIRLPVKDTGLGTLTSISNASRAPIAGDKFMKISTYIISCWDFHLWWVWIGYRWVGYTNTKNFLTKLRQIRELVTKNTMELGGSYHKQLMNWQKSQAPVRQLPTQEEFQELEDLFGPFLKRVLCFVARKWPC